MRKPNEKSECGKVAYTTARLAKAALRLIGRLNEKRGRGKVYGPVAFYRCPDCDKYHLTKKTNRTRVKL